MASRLGHHHAWQVNRTAELECVLRESRTAEDIELLRVLLGLTGGQQARVHKMLPHRARDGEALRAMYI